MAVIGTYAIHKQSELIENEVIQDQEKILSQKVQDIDVFFQDIGEDLREISHRFSLQTLVEKISDQDSQEEIRFWTNLIQQDFSRLADIRKCYAQIQFIDSTGHEHVRVDFINGKSIIQTGKKLQKLVDQYYFTKISSLKKGEFIVLPLMADSLRISEEGFTNPVIRFGMPVLTQNERRVGILVLTAFANIFSDSFSDISIGKMMLIDNSGAVLYHPDFRNFKNFKEPQSMREFQNLYSKNIWDEMLTAGKGTIRNSPSESLSYQKINYQPHNNKPFWIAVYSRDYKTADGNEVLLPVIDFRRNIIRIIVGFLILTLAVALLFGQRFTKPLLKVVDMAKALSIGNLEQLKLDYRSGDEIGVLAESFNAMVTRLRKNILSITRTTVDITGSSNELSTAVQEQGAITAQQSASLTEITATLEELTTSSSQIATNANSVVGISANALSESEKGMADIEVIKEKMNQIAEDNMASTDEIVELGKKSKEIGKVMEIINTIADQTKLIAFNAAIEASSAGEAGRRFEVVASEIRRLADSVMSSTEEIEGTIEEIQRAINRLVIASERGANRIKEGTLLAAQTFTQLEQLVTGAKSTNDASTQISLSTQQQKSATNQVLNALKEIEQGFFEISASIHETSDISQKLSGSSTVLKELVSEYKVDEKTDIVNS